MARSTYFDLGRSADACPGSESGYAQRFQCGNIVKRRIWTRMISHLTIHNFRNFGDLDVSLSQSCVLLGENAAGKSNLLYAMRLVLDNTLPDSARFLRPEDFFDGLAEPMGSTVQVSVDLTGFDQDANAKSILSKYLISVKPFVARLIYQFRPKQTLEGKKPASVEDYEFMLFGGLKEAR